MTAVRRSLVNRGLTPAGLVALRQTLFVAAMMALVHHGLGSSRAPPEIGKSGHDGLSTVHWQIAS
jgi:hypothetical protein